MRRNEERLPARREQGGGLSPWSESGFLSPTSIFSGSPWQMMRRMQEDMDRMFSQFFGGDVYGNAPAAREQWSPSMDVSESDGEWCIEADLPGVNKDDVEVEVLNHHLILRAEMKQPTGSEREEAGRRYYQRERRYGFFERVLPLPEGAQENAISCECRNGVLVIHVPKAKEAQSAARRIPVTDVDQLASETAAGRQRSQSELAMTEGKTESKEREPIAAGRTAGKSASRAPSAKEKPEGNGARQRA
jgi:HSP20 family protein